MRFLGVALTCVLVLSAAALPARAQDSECVEEDTIVKSVIDKNQGDVEPRHLARIIENLKKDNPEQALCELKALRKFGTGRKRASVSTARAPATARARGRNLAPAPCGTSRFEDLFHNPGSQADIIATYAEFKDSWTSNDADREAVAEFYATIRCLDSRPDALAKDPELRKLRRTLESAHANMAGGYFDVSKPDESNESVCADAERRRNLSDEYGELQTSEYAIRSGLLAVAGDLLAVWSGECGDAADLLADAAARLDRMVDEGWFAKSLEGWRWLNDVRYQRAIIALLQRDEDAFRANLKELSAEPVGVVAASPMYRDGEADRIHPAARLVLNQKDAERDRNDTEPYADQIYIASFVIGIPPTAMSEVRKFFSVSSITSGLESFSDLQAYGCSEEGCQSQMKRLNDELTETIVRDDITVVLGSYRDASTADNVKDRLCKRIYGGRKGCELITEPSGVYHRVSVGPMSDSDAKVYVGRLTENKIREYFLSRPRVMNFL